MASFGGAGPEPAGKRDREDSEEGVAPPTRRQKRAVELRRLPSDALSGILWCLGGSVASEGERSPQLARRLVVGAVDAWTLGACCRWLRRSSEAYAAREVSFLPDRDRGESTRALAVLVEF